MLHLNKNSVIGSLQETLIDSKRAELGVQYFQNMGFTDETEKQIYGIIREELGLRSWDSPSEMVAQAVAQVMYGTKEAPHAEKLVDYLINLAEVSNVY